MELNASLSTSDIIKAVISRKPLTIAGINITPVGSNDWELESADDPSITHWQCFKPDTPLSKVADTIKGWVATYKEAYFALY